MVLPIISGLRAILALGGHAVTTYNAPFSAKYRSTVCF
jgi:hypothetical protein